MTTENFFSASCISPLLKVDSDFKIVAFNEACSQFFHVHFQAEIQKGQFFTELISLQEKLISENLESAFKGIPGQTHISFKNSLFQLQFIPVLSCENCITEVSIVISSSEMKAEISNSKKEFNETLEYDRQIYRNLFIHNPDAVYSFDLEGNFVDVNKSSAVLAETSVEKLLSMNFLPLIPKEDQEKVLMNFEKAKSGEVVHYTTGFKSIKQNYKVLSVTNFPIYNEDQIVGVYGIGKDITLDKENELKISEDRKMLRAIIDNIPDYVFVKNRKHESVLSNKKFNEQLLGLSNESNTKGLTPYDYYEHSKAKNIIEDNEKVMATGSPVINRPDIVKTADGREEMILLTKVPLKNEEDQTIGLVGIARDITETYLHNRKQELIFKIIKAFGDKPGFFEATQKTLKLLSEFLGFDYAEYYKRSADGNHLVRVNYFPGDEDLLVGDKKYVLGEGLPGKVWESMKVETIYHAEQRELFRGMILKEKGELKSGVGIPIILEDRLISIICLGSVKTSKKIESQVLHDIAIQIAPAIDNKRAQHQLNDFFKFSPNLIAIIGLDGRFKNINPYFEYKFGFSQEEILDHQVFEFIHPDDLESTAAALNDLYAEKIFEIRCRKKDGDYLWISWRFSQYFKEDNVIFIYGTDITPVQKAQEQIKLSEEKYRSLFDYSPLPMWVLDKDELRFLSVNKAAVELYGYSEEEFYNMTVKDLWVPNQEEKIKKIVEENYDNFFRLKVQHRTKKGKKIIVDVKSNPVNLNGVEARVSLVNDITAKVEAEEKLIFRKRRFKALIQEGSDIISILDTNLNYTYCSPACENVYGLTPSQILNANFRDHIFEEDLIALGGYLEEINTKKRIQLPSYRITDSKGKIRWIETIVTNLNGDPSVQGIVMNSRDITEFVQQERKLIESLERFNIVSKATTDLITDYDINSGQMKFSEAVYEMFGYSRGEVEEDGCWWKQRIHPDDFEAVQQQIEDMIQNRKKKLTIEYRFQCADNSYKYILDRSYLLLDEKNNPSRIIASMQDITERKRHLIAVQEHNERLKEIAWTQSHVVRAPLAKLMGLVDLLKNYRNDLENIDEILENILTSAYELDKIIRKIAVKTDEEFRK